MASLRTLTPDAQRIAAAFVRYLQQCGVSVTVTSARRSLAEQSRLYQRAQAGQSKYPAAAPGKSTHGLGIAFDLKLVPPVYREAGAVWQALGYTWGGQFSDPIHFDLRPRA